MNSTRVVTNRPWRDRNGRWHRGRSIVFLGGYPGYYGYPYDYGFDFGDNDASYDATQQADNSQQPEQYADEQPAPAPVQYAAPAPTAPVRDVGEFILVRKDGKVVMASAFSFSGDRLTYVTRDGLLRSFPAAELDKDATRQMNEASGTTVVLPS